MAGDRQGPLGERPPGTPVPGTPGGYRGAPPRGVDVKPLAEAGPGPGSRALRDPGTGLGPF